MSETEAGRPAAGGIVLGDGGSVVLVRSRNGNGCLFFPKGHAKNGETDEETARREIMEETGLGDLELLDDLGIYERPSLKDPSVVKRLRMYLFWSKPRAMLVPGHEIAEARWAHYQKAAELMGHPSDRAWYGTVYERVREALQRD